MVHVLLQTPKITVDGSLSLMTNINLKTFSCAINDSSDIWGGALEADEDGQDIWKNHPMAEADCTFPVGSHFRVGLPLRGNAIPTKEVCCGSVILSDDIRVCDGSYKDDISSP